MTEKREYVIFIDKKPYLGELDETEKSNYGGEGWNVQNKIERNKLGVGVEGQSPKIIYGWRCLKSEIERIVTRISDVSSSF